MKLKKLADIIINEFKVKRNDVVLAYISFSEINLTDASQQDAVYLLKMILGNNGTLIMHDLADRHNHRYREISTENNSFTDPLFRDIEIFCKMPDPDTGTLFKEPFMVWGSLMNEISEKEKAGKDGLESGYLLDSLYQNSGKIIGMGVSRSSLSIINALYYLRLQRSAINQNASLDHSVLDKGHAGIGPDFSKQDLFDARNCQEFTSKLINQAYLSYKNEGIGYFMADIRSLYQKELQ